MLEYSSDNGLYHLMNDVAMPTMSTVMILKASRSNLFVGLLDGTLAMYNRPPGWYTSKGFNESYTLYIHDGNTARQLYYH